MHDLIDQLKSTVENKELQAVGWGEGRGEWTEWQQLEGSILSCMPLSILKSKFRHHHALAGVCKGTSTSTSTFAVKVPLEAISLLLAPLSLELIAYRMYLDT